MNKVLLLPLLLLFVLPLVNATAHIEMLTFDNLTYNKTCYKISTNTSTPMPFTSPCAVDDDLEIIFKSVLSEAVIQTWNLSTSSVNVLGSVATDCTGSIEQRGINAAPLELNYSIPQFIPIQFAAMCIRTVENYHAVISAIGYNGSYTNFTLQWNNDSTWIMPYTTPRTPNSYDIPAYYPAQPASSTYYNIYDLDNGLNYLMHQSLLNTTELDKADFSFLNQFTIFSYNYLPLNAWTTTPISVGSSSECLFQQPDAFTRNGLFVSQNANNNYDYCIKTSEDQWLAVHRLSHSPAINPHLHVDVVQLPSYFTQTIRLTDTSDLWIKGSTIIADTFRYGVPASDLLNFAPHANTSYDAIWNATDGFIANGGGRLVNPSGKPITSLAAFDYTDTNNLNTFDCSVFEPYATDIAINTRAISPIENRIICINSSNAKNPELFTAIKFVNTTNVRAGNASEFDAYFAIYNAQAIIFSGFQTFPSAIRVNDDVTFSWNTRLNLTTEMKLQFLNPNNQQFSGWITVLGNQNLTKTHSIFVNGTSFTQATSYQVQLVGTDINGTTYASQIFNFNVSDVPLVSAITGLGVCTFSELGFPYPSSISLDGSEYTFTSRYNNSQGITYYCVEYPRAVVPLFTSHNISAVSFDHKRSANTSIEVEQYPFFLVVQMNPSQDCIPLIFNAQQDFCSDGLNTTNAVRQASGSTGAYCAYNPDECFLFNLSADYQCISRAGERSPPQAWILYECFNNFLPAGVPTGNVTMPSTYRPEAFGTTGQQVRSALCLGLNSIFDTTCNQSLWFVGLMISLVIMGGLAFVTKSGLVGTVSGLVSVLAFTGIGWIPIWVGIVLAVIASLLIARFLSDSIMPQAR